MNLDKPLITFCNNDDPPDNLEIIKSDKSLEIFFCQDLAELVAHYKGFIDNIENFNKWDYAKKISNPFELIHQSGDKGLSAIIPISRSYFKLLEIIIDCNLIDDRETYNYAALAEGPGGFVECFIRYRKSRFLGRNDQIRCMTLKSDSNEVPNWNKASDLFRKYKVNITYGEDGTGNLYNHRNIIKFRDELNGNLVDLVTADGGFDYSIDFNQQEQLSAKLIFAELVCALNISAKGANFVLKIFDIYTVITVKILYLLTLYYDSVTIIKPHTSRPANSEKYVVAKGFKGIKEKQRIQLLVILAKWDNFNDNQYLSDIIGINLPNKFLYSLYKLNKSYARLQIFNILKTIIFIEKPLNYDDSIYLKKCKLIYALEWCKKYNNPINNNNMYLY